MGEIAEEGKKKKAEARERRRERRTRPRRRVSSGVLEKPQTEEAPGERAELEVVALTNDVEVEARMLAATLAPTHAAQVAFYKAHGVEDEEKARSHADDMRQYSAEQARICPPQDQSWSRLGALAEIDLRAACVEWVKVQAYAFDELEYGLRVAEATSNTTPLERARFFAVRDKFIDQWQPAGGIDAALIDMLASAFSLYLHWTEIAHKRAIEMNDSMRQELKRYEDRGWKSPYQSAADAVEQAHKLADSYNRQFLRVLRQMRDLRRYTPPLIVNNGGQVNVANQQVNVTQTT